MSVGTGQQDAHPKAAPGILSPPSLEGSQGGGRAGQSWVSGTCLALVRDTLGRLLVSQSAVRGGLVPSGALGPGQPSEGRGTAPLGCRPNIFS